MGGVTALIKMPAREVRGAADVIAPPKKRKALCARAAGDC